MNPPRHAGGAGDRARGVRTALQAALALLARREHSRQELARKLAARGFPGDEVDTAIARAADNGWQDDARFAASLARVRAEAGHGPIRIQGELALHGLGAEAIAEAMAPFEGEWRSRASALVQRRFGSAAGDLAVQRKAADFLLRRGFSRGQARDAAGMLARV